MSENRLKEASPVPVVVGTSGWQYRDWRGVLYPAGVPVARWLEFYASHYPTVENNGTFYRLPGPDTFAAWRSRTPAGFLMVVKASRYLTHIRRLRDPAEPVERLMSAATQLGPRLGPVLLQLPPTMQADFPALDGCLAAFAQYKPPRGSPAGLPPVRVAVECRHDSWWTEDLKKVLGRYDAALCWADRQEHELTPLWRTAGWGYLRLHEGRGHSWPRYTARTLRRWIESLGSCWGPGDETFVFFNNDQNGAAPQDADSFMALAQEAGHQVAAATPSAER
jgi:uncharacterized protein YecE (DUF72 family)